MGNVTRALKAAQVTRDTAYEHRQKDKAFAKRWAEALEQAADWLEREAWRRAVKGCDRGVFQGGKRVGTVREYSDTLMIQLLRGNKPQKFRDNTRIEHTGPGGGPIKTETAITVELEQSARQFEDFSRAREQPASN